jgi:hypothetical protein
LFHFHAGSISCGTKIMVFYQLSEIQALPI